MENLNLLDVLLEYINEHGLYSDLLNWYEMYGNDKKQLDEDLENRYNDL